MTSEMTSAAIEPAEPERVLCPVCGEAVRPSLGARPRRYCSDRCRGQAQRLRNKGLLPGSIGGDQDWRRRGAWHTCPVCRRRAWVPASAEAQWRTCSAGCAAARRRDASLPWNRLQQRLRERMAAEQLTLKDVAAAAGVSRATIRLWYQKQGRFLTSSSLTGLARVLGLSFEAALAEAGGTTGEQEMARTGRSNIATARPASGTAKFKSARQKAGATMRGRPHRPEWNERIRASLIAVGAPAAGARKLRAIQSTAEGQSRQRLWAWLRWHPHPTRGQVIAHAGEIARRLGRPDAEVLAAWKPHLADRGIWALGGRPPMERRHYLIRALLDRWPEGTRGFWPVAAWWVGEAEERAWEPTEVAKWWDVHAPACTRTAFLARPDGWTAAVDRVPQIARHEARALVARARTSKDAAYADFFGPFLSGETRS